MKKVFTELDQLPILLNAEEVGIALRISRANAYVFMHSQAVNCVRVGKRMLLPKTELLRYIEENSGGN